MMIRILSRIFGLVASEQRSEASSTASQMAFSDEL
jgi:hypothetical protein